MAAWGELISMLSRQVTIACIAALALTACSMFEKPNDARFNDAMLQFTQAGQFEMSELRGRKLVDSKCDVPDHMNGRLQVRSVKTEACVTHFDSDRFSCGAASVVQRTSVNFGDVSEDPIDWPEDKLGERTDFVISLQSNTSSNTAPWNSRYGGNVRNGLVDASGKPFNLTDLSKHNRIYRRLLHEADARSTHFRVGSIERLEEIRSIFGDRQLQCGSAAAYTFSRITFYWSPRSLDDMTFDWTFPIGKPFRCEDPLVHGRLLDGRWRKLEFVSWRDVTVEAEQRDEIDSPLTVALSVVGNTIPPVEMRYERKGLKIICNVPDYIVWRHGSGGARVARFKAGESFSCRNARIKGDPAGSKDSHVSYQSEDIEGDSLVHLVAAGSRSDLKVYVDDRVLNLEGTPVQLRADSIHVKCDV